MRERKFIVHLAQEKFYDVPVTIREDELEGDPTEESWTEEAFQQASANVDPDVHLDRKADSSVQLVNWDQAIEEVT